MDLRTSPFAKSLDLEHTYKLLKMLQSDSLKLVDGEGDELDVPPELQEVLAHVIDQMTEGRAVHLKRGEKLVTTQQGAALLGMSRPSFIKLLNEGQMPYHRVGNQRRVRLGDLREYLKRLHGDEWITRIERKELLAQIGDQVLRWGAIEEVGEEDAPAKTS